MSEDERNGGGGATAVEVAYVRWQLEYGGCRRARCSVLVSRPRATSTATAAAATAAAVATAMVDRPSSCHAAG